ncbi:MAG: hypothetical protein H0V66_10675 [Bdellovibrionales bacterium]|nr:hypothetical protein [Bdellovibrionales bacterium]
MKNLLLVTALFFIVTSFAQARSFKAVVRTENNRAQEQMIELEDLISEDSFDGQHFKIVKGKSEEAIKFDAEEELVFRAATAYYHLSIARNYFINKVKSEFVAQSKKMVIRIDHTNQFSELGHFAHDNLDPQFNNALTIPGGKGLASRGVLPWETEIWFRPQKKIHISDINTNGLANQEFKVLMRGFRNQIHMQSLQKFLVAAVQVMVQGSAGRSDPFSTDNVIRTVGSSLLMEFGYHFIDPISKATSRKWYWLDTALIPEIIYHEYAHAALSDHLILSHSTAIIEGMADFFAGQIAGSPKLAKHIKKYNTFNGKNAKRKQDYVLQFEMGEYANTDFVFGMLWEIKNILGEEKGEAFMFNLRKRLTTNSTIRGQLVNGLLMTCDEVCETPFIDKIRILKALNLRGI